MSHKKIVIVSQSHLCRNPRVLKEALALFRVGYRVTILTAIYSNDLYEEDLALISETSIQYNFYSDLRSVGLSSFIDRLLRRLFVLAQLYLRIESEYSLGYGIKKLRRVFNSHRADLYIMHQELATVIGSKMVHKYKIMFDFEDWYSQDLLPESRKYRPLKLLKKAEKIALKNGALTTTTSGAMAQALLAHYEPDRQPEVIYNSFAATTAIREATIEGKTLRLYWFSQTIGEGRGLEFFISALGKSVADWELYLRGNISSSYQTFLKKLVSAKDKLVVLPMQKNDEILQGMFDYHIGLALEPDTPANKNLTISNKFFHYMAAGLPVIASHTKGHAEISTQHPDFIFMYEQYDESHLVALLDDLAAKHRDTGLDGLTNTVSSVYRSEYAWEIEEKKLVHMISKTLENARYVTN